MSATGAGSLTDNAAAASVFLIDRRRRRRRRAGAIGFSSLIADTAVIDPLTIDIAAIFDSLSTDNGAIDFFATCTAAAGLAFRTLLGAPPQVGGQYASPE